MESVSEMCAITLNQSSFHGHKMCPKQPLKPLNLKLVDIYDDLAVLLLGYRIQTFWIQHT